VTFCEYFEIDDDSSQSPFPSPLSEEEEEKEREKRCDVWENKDRMDRKVGSRMNKVQSCVDRRSH